MVNLGIFDFLLKGTVNTKVVGTKEFVAENGSFSFSYPLFDYWVQTSASSNEDNKTLILYAPAPSLPTSGPPPQFIISALPPLINDITPHANPNGVDYITGIDNQTKYQYVIFESPKVNFAVKIEFVGVMNSIQNTPYFGYKDFFSTVIQTFSFKQS